MPRRGNGFPSITYGKGGKGDDSLGLLSTVERRRIVERFTKPLLLDGLEEVLGKGADALHHLPATEIHDCAFRISLVSQIDSVQQALGFNPEAAPDPRTVDLRAAYAIPIIAGGQPREIIGTLRVDSTSSEATELFEDPTFQALVQSLASKVAPYLEVYSHLSESPG